MKKRNLTNKQIRALAYRYAADQVEAALDSGYTHECTDQEDGTWADSAAFAKQLNVVKQRLHARADALGGGKEK